MVLPPLALALLGAIHAAPPAPSPAAADPPPVGTYTCYYFGDYYALTSSSLTQIRVLPRARMQIVGETVPFQFDAATSRLTLSAGKFRGAVAKFQLDSSRKPAIVFPRSENERKGHRIDISDTWCYLDQPRR